MQYLWKYFTKEILPGYTKVTEDVDLQKLYTHIYIGCYILFVYADTKT